MNRISSHWVALITALGLLFVYVGERVAQVGMPRVILSSLGCGIIFVAMVIRGFRLVAANSQRRRVEFLLLIGQILAAKAVGLYFLNTRLSSPFATGVLSALWLVILVWVVCCLVPIETAYFGMRRSPQIEASRIRAALLTGCATAGLLTFAVCAQYVVNQNDWRKDLAYFRTTKPGSATVQLVKALDAPVHVAVFFPPANEVTESVRTYFDGLNDISPHFVVEYFDQAIDMAKAKELNVSNNGYIVVYRNQQKEPMALSLDIERARAQLRTFDTDIYKLLSKVTRTKKTIYFTVGHGERLMQANALEIHSSIARMTERLKGLNYSIAILSDTNGLTSTIPSDAAMVAIIGPRFELTPPEIQTLDQYTKEGGRIFIALDPEAKLSFKELLDPWGVTFSPIPLANDEVYARRTMKLSDRGLLITDVYSSHPSVSSNSRQKFPIVVMGAGFFNEQKQHSAELTVDFPIKSHEKTWNDDNGDFQYDPPKEERRIYNLATAISRRPKSNAKAESESRLIAIADSDGFADELMGQANLVGNVQFFTDSVRWLMGEEQFIGINNQETDVILTRSRTQEAWWFWLTTFGVPLAVVSIGFAMRRRSNKPHLAAGASS